MTVAAEKATDPHFYTVRMVMVGGEGLVEVPYMEEQTGSPAAAIFSFNPSNGLHK